MMFQTVPDAKPTAGNVTVQLVTSVGMSVSVPDRPVNFLGQLVTFHDRVPGSGVFHNRQAVN